MYGSNPTVVHQAAQVARRPTTYILGAPTVVSVASGVTSMVIPYQFNLAPPTPDGTPHTQSQFTISTVTSANPKVMAVPTDSGNAAEVMLLIVLIIVIARRVYLWVIDSAGNFLTHLNG